MNSITSKIIERLDSINHNNFPTGYISNISTQSKNTIRKGITGHKFMRDIEQDTAKNTSSATVLRQLSCRLVISILCDFKRIPNND